MVKARGVAAQLDKTKLPFVKAWAESLRGCAAGLLHLLTSGRAVGRLPNRSGAGHGDNQRPRLLQFSVALQQQRLQVVTGVRPAEPPEHPRLVAGFNGHHAFTLVRLRLWSAGHKRTASPACAGRAAALL